MLKLRVSPFQNRKSSSSSPSIRVRSIRAKWLESSLGAMFAQSDRFEHGANLPRSTSLNRIKQRKPHTARGLARTRYWARSCQKASRTEARREWKSSAI